MGVVQGAALERYRKQHECGTWLDLNRESSGQGVLAAPILDRSIILCIDMIDRVEPPGALFNLLRSWLDHAPVCILTASVERLGTPEVLEGMLREQHLNVEFIGVTASDSAKYEKQTILAVLTSSRMNVTGRRVGLTTPSDFRVVAFMAAYNEEDIIVHSVEKWTDQGIDVHVLENWSTDATYDLVKALGARLPVTVERFPAEGPSKHFDWGAMLARMEALAREIQADWFIRRGADEVLISPWPALSYKDSLYLLDRAGFNCVDHTVINFHPVDDGFEAGADHEEYFRHFRFGRQPFDFNQRKTWKNYGQTISMVDSAGHDLPFEGRRVYPFKFLLKHYPVRSQGHGEKKVFRERKARWNPEERAKGWHTHYDEVEQDHAFVLSPSALTAFEEADFNRTYLVERLSGIGVIRPGPEAEEG